MTTAALPAELKALAMRIQAALQREAEKFSVTDAMPQIELDAVQFTCITDPFNCQPGYAGIWRNARNERCGSLTFNSDGSFFAEYDLFCPHPRDPRWFVEMVTAWGRGDDLTCEAQLISNLGE